jgi:lysozyme
MKVSPQGIAAIKQHESCRLKAYQKKGDRPTIGWGNTFYENGSAVKLGDVITQERADKLFLIKLADFERDVTSLIKVPITQHQFNALVSFAYNVGSDIDADNKAEGLGDSTLLKLVNANPDDPKIYAYTLDTDGIAKIASCEFLKWVSKGTIFEKGLRRRRQHEADMYNTKVFS